MTSDHPSPTTSDLPSPQPSADVDRLFAAADDEPVRIPEWMRQPQEEHPLTRSERIRLGWERHSGKVLGGIGGLLALALLGTLGWSGFAFARRVHDGGPVLPGRTASPGPRPTDGSGNSLGPFVATPAEHFAEGEAAITLPAARATAPFTVQQVAGGLAKVKRGLVEGRLDLNMLSDDPQPFLALLAPDARAAVRDDLAQGANLGYATRIMDDAEPAWKYGDGIRGRGGVEYRSTVDRDGVRVLEITTRFFWVYSFDLWRPQAYPPGAELVTVRDEVVWHLPYPADVRPTSRGLWIDSTAVTVLNASCAAMRKGFIDLAPEEPLRRRSAPAPTGDVYDPGWRPGDGEEC
jgi:hypothetical protein